MTIFKKTNTLLILTILLLSSCSTKRMFTTIDVLRPAETTFAAHVQNLLLVDNSVVQPYNVGHNDYRSFYELERPQEVSLKFDSAAIFCIAGLTEDLLDSYFFNDVKMNIQSLNTTNNFYKRNHLDKLQVDSICKANGADVLFALDKIEITDHLTYPGHNIYGQLDVSIATQWSLYSPHTEKRDTLSFIDEFLWEDEMSKRLPSRYDALVDASILTGKNIASRLIPRWEKQDRYLFTPKRIDYMVAGMNHFTMREWEKAIEYWSMAEEGKSVKLKYQAYNNIAVAYEMMNDYRAALISLTTALQHYQEHISFSFSEFEQTNLLTYWDFLKKRDEELKLIEIQLGK